MNRRRMRFSAMEQNNTPDIPIMYVLKDKNGLFSIEATIEEKEALDEYFKQLEKKEDSNQELHADIRRLSLNVVNKFIEPFKNYAEGFIQAQIGRGNATDTIKHYKQTIKKLEIFFGWLYLDRNGKDYTEYSRDLMLRIGQCIPFGILEDIELEANFRQFLLEYEDVSEQTVATYFRDYRAIAYWGMDEGFIKKHNIVVKTVYSDIKECYSDEEIDRLLKKPNDDASFADVRSWIAIQWILATGNRVGTLINVKISDVDFTDNIIHITSQKNRRVAHLPMIPQLRRALKEYIEDYLVDETGHYVSPYLFPSSYEANSNLPITRQNMSRAIAKFNRSRGVNKTSVHLFRHTFVRNWILKGGDLHSLQRILGHSTLDMVVHYANLLDTDLRPKMEDFSVLATHKVNARGKMIKKRRIK